MHKIVIALLVFGLVCIPTAVTQGPYYGPYPSGPYYSGYYENEYEQQRSFDEYTRTYSSGGYTNPCCPSCSCGGYYENEYVQKRSFDEYIRTYSSRGYTNPYCVGPCSEGGYGQPDYRAARDSECSLWITDGYNIHRYFSLGVPLSTRIPMMAQACDRGQLILYEKYPDGNIRVTPMRSVSNGEVYPLWFTGDTPGEHIIWFYVNGQRSNSITFDVSSRLY